MTEQELLKAFAGEAVLLPKPEGFWNAVATVGIENMQISSQKFTARFLLDAKTKRLFQMTMRPQDPEAELVSTDLLYEILEDGLVQKYGTPTHTSARPDKRNAMWVFPSTVVELSSRITRKVLSSEKLLALVALVYRNAKASSDKF